LQSCTPEPALFRNKQRRRPVQTLVCSYVLTSSWSDSYIRYCAAADRTWLPFLPAVVSPRAGKTLQSRFHLGGRRWNSSRGALLHFLRFNFGICDIAKHL